MGAGRGRSAIADVALALGLGASALALYAATVQHVLVGDGPEIVNHFTSRGWSAVWLHVAYLPAANVLRMLVPDPLLALRALSVISGALGVSAAFLLARALGLGRQAAVWTALVLGLSPPYWFHATTVEVHAPHAAVVLLAALGTLQLPWHRERIAIPAAALLLGVCCLFHTSSPLLGPGWLLLAALGRARCGTAYSPLGLCVRVGLPLAAGVVLALIGADVIRGASGEPFRTTSIGEFLTRHHRSDLRALREPWLRLLGLVPFTALGALLLRRARGLQAATPAAFFLPYAAFIVWFGHHDHGGYTVPVLGFLCVLGAYLFPARDALLGVLWMVPLVQGVLGLATLRSTESAFHEDDRRARIELVREVLPEGGMLVSFDATRQTVQAELPAVKEVNLQGLLRSALVQGDSPAEFAAGLLPSLVELVSNHPPGRVALDASYRLEAPKLPELAPFFDALDAALERAFETRELTRGSWVVLALEARP